MKKRNKTYLRITNSSLSTIVIDFFEGDINKDKIYWKKYHKIKPRYFELKEIEDRDLK